MKKIVLFTPLFFIFCCVSQPEQKINGLSFVAAPEKAEQHHIDPVNTVNANYAAVMPFGFLSSLDSPNIVFDSERQWFGETTKGCKQYITLLRENDIKIMLKPQLWVWHGEFTGDIQMASTANWAQLERSYSDFILNFARLAEEMQVSIFCIGTELEGFVEHRPEYWPQLIKQIRNIYKGQLTYAANWDEYTRTPFWDTLDFIGVDAYFPLSDKQDPTKEDMRTGWQRWQTQMLALSERHGKSILFTEFGYRSMDFTAHKPWLVDQNKAKVNLRGQADALSVVFEEFWNEPWFAGGFVWKWFIDHDGVGGENDNRFTPQNKPAQQVIGAHYGKH